MSAGDIRVLVIDDEESMRFFLERNPGFADGDELVCLTAMEASNTIGRGPAKAKLKSTATMKAPRPRAATAAIIVRRAILSVIICPPI